MILRLPLTHTNFKTPYTSIRNISLKNLIRTTPPKSNIKNNNNKKEPYIHDYSMLPSMVQIRLPTEESENKVKENNLLGYLFEQGGVDFMNLDTNARSFDRYPLTNSKRLAKRTTRPKSVKLLSSDFIEDSLYNPNYGYFSKEAVIFQPDEPFDYKQLNGKDEFMDKWLEAYDKYDKKRLPVLKHGIKHNKNHNFKGKATEAVKNEFQLEKPSLQLWHTPTELFQPYYGEALAKYIYTNYKLNNYPYNDLVIYEVGAGNGTLMLNILDFLEKHEPEVYERTKYRIIEISSKLFNKQNSRLVRHMDKVEIINKSILEWDTMVNEPCFVIALEVFDNLSHDVVRYDLDTNQPFQGYVVVDKNNDFQEFYSPDLDQWTLRFLDLRERGKFPIYKLPNHPLNEFAVKKKLKSALNPLRNNLSDPEYIPTRSVKFIEILGHYFPQHQLLASDFNALDSTIPGFNSPTVQTMYKDSMINVDSYMCEQGYFDIMFPTDFNVMNDIYRQIIGKVSSTCSHKDFLNVWADTDATTTKTGENPMLELYSNVNFIYS